ncbi:MAG: DUF1800 family protein [Candidatus Acidiferrales bacterium]
MNFSLWIREAAVRRWILVALIAVLAGLTSSCASNTGGSTGTSNGIEVSPASPSVRAGATQLFTAKITSSMNPSPTLTWSVNNVAGGNSTIGKITSSGALTASYTAPAVVPSPNTVTVEAADSTDATVNGSAVASLLNPVPQLNSATPLPIDLGPFSITVTGSNFVSGAVVNFGSAQLSTTFVSSTQLTASGTTTQAQVGNVQVTVTNPDPGSATSGALTAQVVKVLAPTIADRFLEQTTFGPTPALISQVQQSGLQGFVTTQFALPVSAYADPDPTETDLGPLQQRFFVQTLTAPDQLRQRVAFALGQTFVIAGDKITDPTGYTNYLRLLEADAFTNYRQIMKDVTLSPGMGHYLDMVNNDKPHTGDHANENYARELMQLFTVGTSLLNEDGSLQLDSSHNPIPTYSQAQVQEFALAFTGWTYPTMPGATQQKHNPAYWTGAMVASDSNHDTTSKQLLQYTNAASGGLLPGGQSAEQDLDGALDNIFNHPNLPPFVSRELIQHLVTSNPSAAYIDRITQVFKNNGAGVRGDMKAVITAILLDTEARRGDDPATANTGDGHLQEPILYIMGLLRAFGAVSDGSSLAGQGSNMGQNALFPPSVFNFFSPNFVIPGTSLNGPEFQILTTATSLNRANFVNTFVFNSLGSGTTVSFSSYASQASNPAALLDSLNILMLHGTMTADMKSSILTAMHAVPAGASQTLQEAQTAIYLIGTSSQYQVQH